MPRSTFVEIPQDEPAQMLAALRRARYGYLLALPILLLYAAGRRPKTIAAVLFCSRSSVVPHRACLADGDAQLGARRAGAAPAPRAPHRAGSNAPPLAAGPAQGPSPGLWLVPYALEWRHPGPDAGGQAGHQGVG